MKKFSSAQKAAMEVSGNKFALVGHTHDEYVPKQSNTLVEIGADLLFTGRLFGIGFEIPSVATIAERDNYAANFRYEGFLLYVEDVQETYQLRGGITNADWRSIAGASGSWGSITGNIADQSDLQTLLAGYSQTGHAHAISDVTGLQTALDNKANTDHQHEIEDINGLGTVLINKSDANHIHEIGSVTGLQAALDGKAAFQHTHVIAEISNLGLFSSSADGLVPKTGTASENAFLKADGTWEIPTVAAPEIVWGGLTGTLSDQTDLQTALDAKAGTATFTSDSAGLVPASGLLTTAFLRGDGTWATPPDTEISWGEITGSLGDQTDLANILNSKVDDSQVQTNVPAGAVFTDTTYTAFTALAEGLTPASGGGTTNFLRADGAWVAPQGGTWGQITGTLSSQTDLQAALDAKESTANKGVANGYAALDAGGVVPASQLPSYVDDVLEFANEGSFPVTGESGKIYIALDTLVQYRWTGSTYMQLTSATAEWGSISGVLSAQSDLQAALDSKVDDSQVQTDVPAGAVFTDTTYSTFDTTTDGLVPQSGADTDKFLRGDGTWAAVPDYLTDAPSDGNQYARKDGLWSIVEIPDAGPVGTIGKIDMGTITGTGDATIDAGGFV